MDVFIWIMIIILFTLVEIMTINLTTIWYIVSAVVSLIVALFTTNFYLQFGVFAILGTILLLTTRPFLKKFMTKKIEATNLDRVIGMEAVVTEEISKNKIGEVKVDGKTWSACSEQTIDVNCIVKVLQIDGVKLKVERIGEND